MYTSATISCYSVAWTKAVCLLKCLDKRIGYNFMIVAKNTDTSHFIICCLYLPSNCNSNFPLQLPVLQPQFELRRILRRVLLPLSRREVRKGRRGSTVGLRRDAQASQEATNRSHSKLLKQEPFLQRYARRHPIPRRRKLQISTNSDGVQTEDASNTREKGDEQAELLGWGELRWV